MLKNLDMALTINPGAGQLGCFLARELRELAQSMILAYDAASGVDSYNSKLDQMIYALSLRKRSNSRYNQLVVQWGSRVDGSAGEYFHQSDDWT